MNAYYMDIPVTQVIYICFNFQSFHSPILDCTVHTVGGSFFYFHLNV